MASPPTLFASIGLDLKTCSKCKQPKSFTEFYKNRSRSDGFSHYCKPCDKATTIGWQRRNPNQRNAWQSDNPEKAKKAWKTYRLRNRSKVYSWNQRRRALKSGCGATLTAKEWQEILTEFNGHCFWCGAPWNHQDHIVPLSKGGSHSKMNVVPACATCNLKKNDRDPLVFLFEMRGIT